MGKSQNWDLTTAVQYKRTSRKGGRIRWKTQKSNLVLRDGEMG